MASRIWEKLGEVLGLQKGRGRVHETEAAPGNSGPALVARLVVDLSEGLSGYTDPVVFGVGHDGSILAAARRSAESPVFEQGIGTFPKATLDQATDYVVLRWRGGGVESLQLRNQRPLFSFVQPVPGGVLLVAARCQWKPERAIPNAIVFDDGGREQRRFVLGDGIADVRTLPNGSIWASYFDEGVFGNYGWGNPGPAPVGASGLVHFGATGERISEFDSTAAGTDSICDAYALCSAEDGSIWVYFYTEFPIVRLAGGTYKAWSLGVAGARAMAVHEPRVLLFGDYKRHSLARVVELGRSASASVVQEREVVDEVGQPLGQALAYGAGRDLYMIKDRRVLVVRDW